MISVIKVVCGILLIGFCVTRMFFHSMPQNPILAVIAGLAEIFAGCFLFLSAGVDKILRIRKAKLAAFAAATNNELLDPENNDGKWLVDCTETLESFEDYIGVASRGECSEPKFGELAGLSFCAWDSWLVSEHCLARPLSMIDIGDRRFVLFGTNLSRYV